MRLPLLPWKAVLLVPLLALALAPAGEGQAGKGRATLRERATLKGHEERVNSVAFSPDGRTPFTGKRGAIQGRAD